MAKNSKDFLVSVADVAFYVDGALAFTGTTALNTSISVSMEDQEVAAGKGAKTLFKYKYGRKLSPTIEMADWNLSYIAANTGSQIATALRDVCAIAECVTLTKGVGTLAHEPVAGGKVYVEKEDGTIVEASVTAMKAYNIKANNAQSIIDSLNILGNNYATSSADLGEGLSNSASSLAVSGNDINQSLAMLTGMAEITQSAPEAGNALKILSMRIRGYDEQTDSYTNDTEELSGAIADLTKTAKTPGGISLFTDDSKQTYKDTYTLMKDISEVYDDLTDKKKAELLEKLAGKNRGNQIAALIQGFQSGQVQKAYEDSINSEGSAQQEQDRWLNSIEAKQQQFQAAMQNLATSTISSDFFKGITDTGTGALNVLTNIVDKFGLLNTAAVGLGIFQGKNNSGESTWDSPHAFFKTTYAA